MDLAAPFVNLHNIRFINDAAAIMHGYPSIQEHVRWASPMCLTEPLRGQSHVADVLLCVSPFSSVKLTLKWCYVDTILK
jgi:hypothetical protein